MSFLLLLIIKERQREDKERMVKSITIGSKTYDMKSSMHMFYMYRQRFDESALARIGAITKKQNEIKETKDPEKTMELMDEMLDFGLKIAYVMACESKDKEYISYENWLKEVDSTNMNWVNEVIALAMTTFQGQI